MANRGPQMHDPASTAHVISQPTRVDEGRRDRKKAATRRAIRSSALALVSERGFARVTVEDIADAADVAPRTFFNYFQSKESALIDFDPVGVETMRVNLLGRPADEPPLVALRTVLVEYATNLAEDLDEPGGHSAWFRRFCVVRAEPDLLGAYAAKMAEVERQITRAIADRLGVDTAGDPYPALLTATAFAAMRVAALHWSAGGGVDSLGRLTAAAIDTLSAGLGDSHVFSGATLGVSWDPPSDDTLAMRSTGGDR
ncbi:MAG TPA: TetR family transcriptional regulator [Acidimicrobiales bacterium]|jgi:AcrR family transcriptional regulator|nr:TetR family transcriptional regulator [Acidimicrobiales bacterium]